jgi:cytosine/adenosine deaminase-related metal-dependent hydrolase
MVGKGVTTMSLVLDLPPELENELATEAARLGLSLPEYVLRLLAVGGGPKSAPRSGAELLAYWQGEGLVGTRPDITDSPAHARALREQAEKRTRP